MPPFDPISYILAKRGSPALSAHRTQTPLDHPDESVTRAKLEYPTLPFTLSYASAKGMVEYLINTPAAGYRCLVTTFSVSDAAMILFARNFSRHMVRLDPVNNNAYVYDLDTTLTSKDEYILRYTAGTATNLGNSARDVSDLFYVHEAYAVGASLKFISMGVEVVSVTDTAHASGRWGVSRGAASGYDPPTTEAVFTTSPEFTPLNCIAYFEVPVTGSGTEDDPYRALMPEELAEDPEWGRVNRLALPHSSLIPCDRATGKPIHGTAIVRVFDQPDRQPHLRPIGRCLEALRSMPRVRKLSREEAIKEALRLDDLLHPLDLVSRGELGLAEKVAVKDYIEWRESQFRVEMSGKIVRKYVAERKW